MTGVAVVAFAVAAAGSTAADAYADSPDRFFGGCFFTADPEPGTDVNVGVIGDHLSLTSKRYVPPALIGATVTCWVEVNGVEAPGTRHTYGDPSSPVQFGADPLTFTAGADDWVDLCETVVFADGTTQSGCPLECTGVWDIERGCGVAIDLLNEVFATETGYVDPAVCPALVAAAGSYGPITIALDGDVYLPDPLGLWSPVYDCPPYLGSS
jgi:hypothetical protein